MDRLKSMLWLCGWIFTVAFKANAGAPESLPLRTTAIPDTTESVPHVQLNVKTDASLIAELRSKVAKIPDVSLQSSILSLPGAEGFWVRDGIPLANPQAIVGGREFAHLHPDGSLHASLPPELAKEAVKNNWATFHPWSSKRLGWEGFVMIYTPSTQTEVDVVYALVVSSFNYVTGKEINAQSLSGKKSVKRAHN
ncbi:luciferase domain-containing protein [Grimontia sp. NTOU-MAR1]|uniref:luciferase domain-containing protein n=1 Tax=Grimontia sp. NTOU-MAR1 TaxID=3111011 RepID=UPI002DBB076A|nr:luciferase family protein [Grimontia sp. NTOU-MAR1]WRW00117.1 luciferase family protein [Grimontia sp. NTOU-MAR1]